MEQINKQGRLRQRLCTPALYVLLPCQDCPHEVGGAEVANSTYITDTSFHMPRRDLRPLVHFNTLLQLLTLREAQQSVMWMDFEPIWLTRSTPNMLRNWNTGGQHLDVTGYRISGLLPEAGASYKYLLVISLAW